PEIRRNGRKTPCYRSFKRWARKSRQVQTTPLEPCCWRSLQHISREISSRLPRTNYSNQRFSTSYCLRYRTEIILSVCREIFSVHLQNGIKHALNLHRH